MTTLPCYFSGVIAAAAAVVGATVYASPTRAGDVSFKDFPYLIYCHYSGSDHAFYFSRLDDDGIAVYMTPDKLAAGMITVSGVAQKVGGDPSGTCGDKTLEELRSAGQAFDLPR